MMITYTGKHIDPLALNVEDIDIEDIAHHLSCINRFNGALRRPVNVACHSIHVCRLLHGTGWEMEGLLHDAPEAYLGDISRGLKNSPDMSRYRLAEFRAWDVICVALDLRSAGRPEANEQVRWADDLMLRYEAMRESKNTAPFEPVTESELSLIRPWSPISQKRSEVIFLEFFERLDLQVRPRDVKDRA